MPLRDYGVFAGQVRESRAEGGTDSPHFQVKVQGGGAEFRIAVNVMSQLSPPDLLYVADDGFRHPVVAGLPGLADGFTSIASQPGGSALDYIRGNLFDPAAMRPMPSTAPGPDNDLADRLSHYVGRAAADPTARAYAFGERWGPEPGRRDKVFGFDPGNGVHDIHMNQGSAGSFTRDNGVWQDGGLLINFPSTGQWVAIFLAFQSQAWHTDDRTGHPIPGPGPGEPIPEPGEPLPEPSPALAPVRIMSALVNSVGPSPEKETVTLLNASSQGVDLTGWALLDRMKRAMSLDGVILPAGEAVRVPVQLPVQLSNSGGLITLLDPDGLKVDGVAYTSADPEGWTIAF